jgi:hypothetical protein
MIMKKESPNSSKRQSNHITHRLKQKHTIHLEFYLLSLVILTGYLSLTSYFGSVLISQKLNLHPLVPWLANMLALTYLLNKPSSYTRMLVPFLGAVSLALLILALFVTGADYFYFDNYSFARFHLIPVQVSLSFASVATNYIVLKYLVSKTSQPTSTLFYFFPLYLIMFSALARLPALIAATITKPALAVSQRNLSFDDKLKLVYGEDIEFINFVRQNTPQKSSILIPPSRLPWRHTGHPEIMRSFLYPRTVITASQFSQIEELPLLSDEELKQSLSQVDYVLISSEEDGNPGDEYQLWPDFAIEADYILLYDFQTKSVTKIEDDYQPEAHRINKSWGLIKPSR